MQPIVMDGGAWSVHQSVCHDREPCKTDESIKVSFEIMTGVGPRNHVLDGGISPFEGAILRGEGAAHLMPTLKHRLP